MQLCTVPVYLCRPSVEPTQTLGIPWKAEPERLVESELRTVSGASFQVPKRGNTAF